MGADPNLSDMKATYYPPSIQPAFMGAHPPIKNGYGMLSESAHISYFQNYRNENLSKFQMPPYEWGITRTPYSPRPDIAISGKGTNWQKMLDMSPSPITPVNLSRQSEINDFYKLTQLHREQYKDHTGRFHPYNYFRTADYQFQCPSDPTTKYMKSPQYYVKYKDPAVLPITLERSFRAPPLPARALTGRFAPNSDIKYKR